MSAMTIGTNRGAAHLRGRIGTPRTRRVWRQGMTVQAGNWSYNFGGRWVHVRDVFPIEVVNTRTERVVYRDDAFGFADAVAHCNRAVAVCREAWSMSISGERLL